MGVADFLAIFAYSRRFHVGSRLLIKSFSRSRQNCVGASRRSG